MPDYTDQQGRSWTIRDWPGTSYKARVINNAYATSNFDVVSILGTNSIVFQCFWCKKWVTSAGIEGDHVVQQSLGNSDSLELRRLFREAERATNEDGSSWNLALSCSECNGGSRNKQKRMSRGDFRKDRDGFGPSGVSV